MIFEEQSVQLINPAHDNQLALMVEPLEQNEHLTAVRRNPFYSAIWIKKGEGRFRVDLADWPFSDNSMLFFTPYQPFNLHPEGVIEGVALHFHSDFFCIEKHKKEVACNGVLFNNLYEPPSVFVDDGARNEFEGILNSMVVEMKAGEFAQTEMLVTWLKLFLIKASRLKVQQSPQALADVAGDKEPFLLARLKDHIEAHYRSKHTPADYAELLHITPKTLGKLVKTHWNRTPTAIIQERILVEAKRELYLTNKSVKEIAWELGFGDEFYFSRLFKKNVQVSPQVYRETVGMGRG
jgi:AraC family transcriptional activator of pobA